MKITKKKTTSKRNTKKTLKSSSKATHARTVDVVELFAGVGGFRIGLEKASKRSKTKYNIVWSNQWEPHTKMQIASDIYSKRFKGGIHLNDDIATVDVKDIPHHNLLVGGFPCQDYSVARTLNQAAGLQGKKGVLWWEIHRIINEMKRKPEYLLLENVDRMLKSPATQRGRDFAIMLASLSDLGYAIEWRVINAADYGFPQRRRRIFIFAYHKRTKLFGKIKRIKNPIDCIFTKGVLAKAFPVEEGSVKSLFPFHIDGDLADITERFNRKKPQKSPFENAGLMIDRDCYTSNVLPKFKGKATVIGDILISESEVPPEYYVKCEDLKKWEFLKGAKKIKRRNKKTGHEYTYDEGSMTFPDRIDAPSRTIVTGEGGSTPSRFKHVVKANGRYRRLTPIELERLNMFPDDHTKEATPIKRAFLMGNALVVGVVEKIGKELIKEIQLTNNKHSKSQ